MTPRPRNTLFAQAGLVLVLALGATTAIGQSAPPSDPQAGAPLAPADAAGTWTLSSKGGAICAVTLKAKPASDGAYPVVVPQACQDAYAMGPVTAWKPTGDGMAFTGTDGSTIVAFSRWSNSLLVSKRASGTDLQLMRGTDGQD
jgi:protease inhibitor Inh